MITAPLKTQEIIYVNCCNVHCTITSDVTYIVFLHGVVGGGELVISERGVY